MNARRRIIGYCPVRWQLRCFPTLATDCTIGSRVGTPVKASRAGCSHAQTIEGGNAGRVHGSRPSGFSDHLLALAALNAAIIDLASLSDRARRRGSGSTSRIDPSSSRSRSLRYERLVGVRIPSEGAPANGGPTLLDFDGNARNGEARALSTPQCRRFPLLRLWRSSRRPSERAHFSDSLVIFDPLVRRSVGGPILPVGFSLVGAVAAYLTKASCLYQT
jgi:hypothetical protein